MKVVSGSDDSDVQEVIDDEDLQLAAQIEKERKEKRAQKLKEKREKAGKTPKKTPAKKRPPPKKRRRASSEEEEDSEEERRSSRKKKTDKKKKKKAETSESEESSDEEEDEDKGKTYRQRYLEQQKNKKKKQAETSESEESEEEEEKKSKKKKTSSKKSKKVESESEEEESDEAPKKKKQKKKRVAKESESDEEEEEKKERKKKAQKKKHRKESSDEEEEEEEKVEKKKKAQKKRKQKESSSEEEEEEEKKKKKPQKRKHQKTSSEEEEEEEEKVEKKKVQKRKQKKPSSEEEEESDEVTMPKLKKKQSAIVDESGESDLEVMPKPRKRGAVVLSESDEEMPIKKKVESENDSSEEDRKAKRNNKKKDVSDSDDGESSDGSINVTRKKSKKEKKEKPEKKKKGIIMDSSDLAKETIDAENAEKERRKRLEKKQKEFNGIVLEEGEDLTEVLTGTSSQRKLKSVVLDPDAASEDPKTPVEVHQSLVSILKPHQAHGVQFMYDCAFESIERLNTEGSGGILAHCMGLGKTLQVITFLHTVMMHPKIGEKCRRVLVVVPKNVIINWFKEFQKWLVDNDEELDTIEVNELDSYKTVEERRRVLHAWHKSTDPSVMIIGYDMFRILTVEDDPKKKKTKLSRKMSKAKEDFRKYLQDPGPDMIVCDEAHKLKNDDSALSKCMVKIRTRRRICLTGTPLQNNLMEYHCMVNFVKPGLLGTKTEFANRFVNIINRGRTKDASALEVSFMKRRCHVLYDHLKKCVDRKDYRVLTEAIPPKQEYVINVRLTERQCELYKAFLSDVVGDTGLSKRLLPDYHMFSRIWTHPHQLIIHEQRMERERVMKEEQEEEEAFIDDDESESEESVLSLSSESEDSFVASDDDEDSGKKKKKNKKKKPERKSRRAGGADEEDDAAMNILQQGIRASRRLAGEDVDERECDTPPEYTGWFSKLGLCSEEDKDDFSLSNKLVLLMAIIKKCEEIGDKLLVFSQSLESLALIRRMLEYMAGTGQWFSDDHEALNAEGETWSWLEGEDYMTIDGSVQSVKRDAVQTQFNDPENLRARLMLISTRAGSLGTNMVAANRVVIFDACWNPSHDTQSLFRVYRFGQTKPVYIYRFIAQGTMEERIYKRQVTKESTSMRVVDEAQIQRHYLGHDLTELYQFTPAAYDPDVEIACAPPKDRLLADVIHQNQFAVVDYIEHDTLFANVEDEKLTEQEMKDAWTDYEKDKAGLPQRLPYDPSALRGIGLNGMIVGPHMQAMLQRQQTEIMRAENLQHDVLFKELNKMRTKDSSTALKIVLLRTLLEQILPYIPQQMRGGMSEFNTHFIRLAHDADRRGESQADLLRKSLESFRTVIKMVRPIPQCAEPLARIQRAYPYLFTDVA